MFHRRLSAGSAQSCGVSWCRESAGRRTDDDASTLALSVDGSDVARHLHNHFDDVHSCAATQHAADDDFFRCGVFCDSRL